jgi:type II secretion system protein G
MLRRAFTLIELLIVVAIIAILAAIAVPNLLEAQVRAKVSRVKNDLRTVVTALEIFAVDNGHYPGSIEETVGRMLTTSPPDVFQTRASSGEIVSGIPYRYINFTTSADLTDRAALAVAGDWAVFSVGPDMQLYNNSSGDTSLGIRIFRDYDPTNGTVSMGNIFRTRARTNEFGTFPFFYQVP